jgi:hypothetical protein
MSQLTGPHKKIYRKGMQAPATILKQVRQGDEDAVFVFQFLSSDPDFLRRAGGDASSLLAGLSEVCEAVFECARYKIFCRARLWSEKSTHLGLTFLIQAVQNALFHAPEKQTRGMVEIYDSCVIPLFRLLLANQSTLDPVQPSPPPGARITDFDQIDLRWKLAPCVVCSTTIWVVNQRKWNADVYVPFLEMFLDMLVSASSTPGCKYQGEEAEAVPRVLNGMASYMHLAVDVDDMRPVFRRDPARFCAFCELLQRPQFPTAFRLAGLEIINEILVKDGASSHKDLCAAEAIELCVQFLSENNISNDHGAPNPSFGASVIDNLGSQLHVSGSHSTSVYLLANILPNKANTGVPSVAGQNQQRMRRMWKAGVFPCFLRCILNGVGGMAPEEAVVTLANDVDGMRKYVEGLKKANDAYPVSLMARAEKAAKRQSTRDALARLQLILESLSQFSEDNEKYNILKFTSCAGCLKLPFDHMEKFRVCSACKSVAYCSLACQKSDWSTHKTKCKSLKAEKKQDPQKHKRLAEKGKIANEWGMKHMATFFAAAEVLKITEHLTVENMHDQMSRVVVCMDFDSGTPEKNCEIHNLDTLGDSPLLVKHGIRDVDMTPEVVNLQAKWKVAKEQGFVQMVNIVFMGGGVSTFRSIVRNDYANCILTDGDDGSADGGAKQHKMRMVVVDNCGWPKCLSLHQQTVDKGAHQNV